MWFELGVEDVLLGQDLADAEQQRDVPGAQQLGVARSCPQRLDAPADGQREGGEHHEVAREQPPRDRAPLLGRALLRPRGAAARLVRGWRRRGHRGATARATRLARSSAGSPRVLNRRRLCAQCVTSSPPPSARCSAILASAMAADDAGRVAGRRPPAPLQIGVLAAVDELLRRTPRDAGEDLPGRVVAIEAAPELAGIVVAHPPLRRRSLQPVERRAREIDEQLWGLHAHAHARVLDAHGARAPRIDGDEAPPGRDLRGEPPRGGLEARTITGVQERQPAAGAHRAGRGPVSASVASSASRATSGAWRS